MFVVTRFIIFCLAGPFLQISHLRASYLPQFSSLSVSPEKDYQNDRSNYNNEDVSIDRDAVDINSAESGLGPRQSHRSQADMCPHCGCRTINRKMRIVGGQLAEHKEFPWMAALSRKGKFYCGATIITKQHLLTAAHCVEGFLAREIRASLGGYNRALKNETSKTVMKIKQIIRHPEFEISNFKNDIAILKLDSDISFFTPHIQPACLPNSEDRNYAGVTATVTGWGRTGESKPISNEMRKVDVPIMSNEDCRRHSGYMPDRITENMMCAGHIPGKKDSCQGDSGGPLQIPGSRVGTMEVVGIVSWGRGCARPNFPGVYTRIASYMNWLESQIENECACRT